MGIFMEQEVEKGENYFKENCVKYAKYCVSYYNQICTM